MKKFLMVVLMAGFLIGCTPNSGELVNTNLVVPSGSSVTVKDEVVEPLADAGSRVTKKMFGTEVSPGHSTVEPERFSGFHTGVDFETTAAEMDSDVQVMAICDGRILQSRTATGYGGLLVESCKLNGGDVTVIYGHIKHDSVKKKVGDELKAGEFFAVLGKGYSTETDGERKHLHLGIHKGTDVNILGYVQSQGDLNDWIDFESLIKN